MTIKQDASATLTTANQHKQRISYVGGMLCDRLNEGLDNASIDVEKVITGHARFPWHTSRDDNQVSTLQGSC